MLRKVLFSIIPISIFLVSILYSKNILDKEEIKYTNKENILVYYQDQKKTIDQYIGILDIPKINLKRGFYPKESHLNTLSKNIYYLQESIPLEENNSMMILAAHRGSSSVAFFDDLEDLQIGDEIYLDYQNNKYTYILKEIYDELKDGHLNIYRDDTKDSLILITCNKYKKKYQTIYVSYRKED